MLLSTEIEGLSGRFGEAEAIRIVSRAGFEAFDLSLFCMSSNENSPFNGDGYLEYAHSLRAIADECGIVCNQAHAPFPTGVGTERDEEIFQKVVRSLEIASVLGAKIIVVHPIHYLYHAKHSEETKQLNLAFYRRLIPYCEKYQIQVATENMWRGHRWDRTRIIDSACSRAEEFCEYVDMLDSPWIVGCLDLGHVGLVGEDMTRIIRALGKKRLRALHIHDVDMLHDSHTLPFLGKMDFEEITAALAEIDYDGDVTLEAMGFTARIPDALIPAACRFMRDTAAQIRTMIQEKRNAI